MRGATAQMDWTARFRHPRPAPLATSAHAYAQIGHEGDGSFF